MKRACADTHALVWALTTPRKLGKAAARWFRDLDAGRAEIFVPAVVAVELALLRQAGRKLIAGAELEAACRAQPALILAELGLREALEFEHLVGVPDLFDRLIMSAARVRGTPLITKDEAIVDSGLVETIWD